LEEEWAEHGVKFIASLTDPGQPYSCSEWQNGATDGMPMVIDENQSSTGFFSLFHDSWSAFPTFVLIDHTMTVRAKPWTLENNSNTSSCDGSNNSVSGWSGGDTEDFLQQLLDECGDLCINGGCSTSSGDVNEDEILNIQDLITMVNHILGSSMLADCSLEAADMNVDGIVNIQDLISLVNAILGSSRSSELNGSATIDHVISGNDLIFNIESDIDIAGIQLSVIGDESIDFQLKDNSHVNQESNHVNGMNHYLAYSIFNQPFDSRTNEILIKSAGDVSLDGIQIIVADINGDLLYLTHSNSGEIYQSGPHVFELAALYPNPFNPSTEVRFSLPMDGHVKLAAYDIRGQEVAMIFEGSQTVGQHSYTWNASDLASGVYYVRLQAGSMTTSQKALLIK
jgi:hypothetical protein